MLSRLMTRREQGVLLFVGLAIVAGALSLYWYRSAQMPAQPPAGIASPVAETPPAPAPSVLPIPEVVPPLPAAPPEIELAVSVAGAVRKPGLYRLDGDPRVQDALDAAGGLSDEADVSDINLAAKIIDGTTLSIPTRAEAGGFPDGQSAAAINPPGYTIRGWQDDAEVAVDASPVASEAPEPGGAAQINLQTATQEQLETLPGIGPKLAASILQYREEHGFATVDDLKEVSGIGDKRFEAVLPFVHVE